MVEGYDMIKALNSIGMFTSMNSTVGLHTESRLDHWIEENISDESLFAACVKFLDIEVKDFKKPEGWVSTLAKATKS